jgi:hypothetical protein
MGAVCTEISGAISEYIHLYVYLPRTFIGIEIDNSEVQYILCIISNL